jgi:GGDEF domain-containing protein
MIKYLLTWPLIIFSLLLILLLSSYYGVYQLTESISRDETNLKVISLANNISSYVKRAEGHLFLYLTLGDKADRGKFFTRINSLKDNILKLNATHKFHTETYLKYTDEMLHVGTNLIDIKDKSIINNNKVLIELYKDELLRLHKLSSAIRSTGVQLVNDATAQIDAKKDLALAEAKNLYIFLLLSGITCLVLIVMLIKKRSEELEYSKKLGEDLDRISNTDALTKIGNRRSFNSAFINEWQRAIRNKKTIALMIIDIDYFKLFNDTYGHVEGDNCLANAAKALQSCMKRPADSIWRYGGALYYLILSMPMQLLKHAGKRLNNYKYHTNLHMYLTLLL